MKSQIRYDDAIQFIESLLCMAVLDKEGRYLYVNPGWSKATGIPLSEAIGKRVWDVVPETAAGRVLETGKPVFGEYQVQLESFTSYFPRLAPDGSLNGCYLYTFILELDNAKALNRRINELSNQVEYYQRELARERGARYGLDSIVGRSPAITRVKEQIQQAARSNSTVLIEGETGTGKELIAHAIHALSPRRAANFVRVNCSAIPPELMESEFFGYKAGAFTGASHKGKVGRFQLAEKGSIFLDEINLLSETMQPKFLRVLQEREIDPVGGDKSVPIDVRVIAASNTPLENLVDQGKFRRDLFYRLNVIRIVAPPLRNRTEDIPLLVRSMIDQLNCQLGMCIQDVSPDVLEMLMNYDWPGNVRELRNAVESAMNLADSDVLRIKDFERLENYMRARQYRNQMYRGENNIRRSKQALEKELMKNALAEAGGNRTKAAEALGISRSVFYRKLRTLGVNG